MSETYQGYGSIDAVVTGWKAAVMGHSEWVDQCFREWRAGEITSEDLQERVKHLALPISDQDAEWAKQEAMRLRK